MILRGEEISTPLTVEQVSVRAMDVFSEARVGSLSSSAVSAGRGLQRLHGHGALLSMFQLDHLQDQQSHQGQRRLQVHQHPRHLWFRELRGAFGPPGHIRTFVVEHLEHLLLFLHR